MNGSNERVLYSFWYKYFIFKLKFGTLGKVVVNGAKEHNLPIHLIAEFQELKRKAESLETSRQMAKTDKFDHQKLFYEHSAYNFYSF